MDNNENKNINTNETEEDGFSIRDLFNIIKKHIWLILILTALAGAAVLLVTKLVIAPKYSSTSSIYIADTSDINLTDLQIASSLSDDYMVIITTRPFIESVKERVPEALAYTNDQIKGMIKISNQTGTHILAITVTNDNPVFSANLANAIAEISVAKIPTIVKIEPPVIIESAIPNNTPVSPNAILYTAVGLLAGLVISIALAFFIEMCKNSLKSREDVKGKLGLEVLGIISDYNEKREK